MNEVDLEVKGLVCFCKRSYQFSKAKMASQHWETTVHHILPIFYFPMEKPGSLCYWY